MDRYISDVLSNENSSAACVPEKTKNIMQRDLSVVTGVGEDAGRRSGVSPNAGLEMKNMKPRRFERRREFKREHGAV